MDESSSWLEATYTMVSCLSSSTRSSVGWYVDTRVLRHMTYDRSLFSKFEEKDEDLSVELGYVYLSYGRSGIHFH